MFIHLLAKPEFRRGTASKELPALYACVDRCLAKDRSPRLLFSVAIRDREHLMDVSLYPVPFAGILLLPLFQVDVSTLCSNGGRRVDPRDGAFAQSDRLFR
jgi:hypothetical protein